jgi:hypothetical protein
VEKALKEAQDRRSEFVVLHIDTPGGRVDVTDRVIALLERANWTTVVAWVDGPEKRALSAGAYLCLTAHKIAMAPGATIGAATPYLRIGPFAAIDEKFTSAFRARFRSLAQARGHPVALVDAMVDNQRTAVHVTVDGKSQIVTAEEARRMEQENKDAFKRGRTISERGELVTLTSTEAREYGLSLGDAATLDELARLLGLEKYDVKEASWLPDWVKTETAKRAETIEKLRGAYTYADKLARDNDPRGGSYIVEFSGAFTDGGRVWRERTDRCLAYLQQCAAALKELERLSKDERYDFPLEQEILNDMKVKMMARVTTLQNERNSRHLP